MEIKVSVEGVQRIVCGVTEKTTCQEMVLALAKALGRTGRYTLKEQFKGYERNVAPDERLLQCLEKYGEQAKEVELTLHYLGPSQNDGSNQPGVNLRRAEGGWKAQRGSLGASLHRQSLPPLSHLQCQPPPEERKRPKRKSLTLMEEAWSWLEGLGRGGKEYSTSDKGKSLKDYRDEQLDNMVVKQEKIAQASRVLQGRNNKKHKNKTDSRAKTSYPGNKAKEETGGGNQEWQQTVPNNKGSDKEQVNDSHHDRAFEAEEDLRRLIIQQQAQLGELKHNIEFTDEQIRILETKAETTPQMSEEEEQLEFWLNELRAEEGYEKDLQKQFLKLKEKAAECKNNLEEYKIKLQLLNRTNGRHSQCQQINPHEKSTTEYFETIEVKTAANGPTGVCKEKSVITKVESRLPYIFVTANQITESQPSGPSELREWWSRWTESQKAKSGFMPKVVHRSEIKIHLGGTRV